MPHRSIWFPRVVFAVALVAGLPLYLRAPLWCDITLYDVAARNLLDGGVHYRDVFDTNLPGFVWALTALRWAFGNGSLVVRMADLAVVIGIVALIDRVAKWGGASLASRWWALAGMAVLYPFVGEQVHIQRDTWMALPALAAVALRIRRACLPREAGWSQPETVSCGRSFGISVLEGLFWGLAVWLKPHVVVMAAGTWLLTARRVAMGTGPAWKCGLVDLVGNLTGGLAVGATGVAWLAASGTWPHFVTVMTVWNPEYTKLAGQEFFWRLEEELFWYPPWSLFLPPTFLLAVASIVDARPFVARRLPDVGQPGPVGRVLPGWLWDREAGSDARFARSALAGLYLLWAIQAFLIQRAFTYAHMPETLLMLGLWAAHRWTMAVIPLLWLAITGTIWLAADMDPGVRARVLKVAADKHASGAPGGQEPYLVRHPLADLDQLRCWPDCWRLSLSSREECALWDRLRRVRDHEAAISWEELYDVAEYLRGRGVRDREVLAWHDSPHAIYLLLGSRPGIRFMHIGTAQSIGGFGYAQVQTELAATAGTARFAIGDLAWATGLTDGAPTRPCCPKPPGGGCNLLPAELLPCHRRLFPFNQPVVFRSGGGAGRYTVHELRPPLGDGDP